MAYADNFIVLLFCAKEKLSSPKDGPGKKRNVEKAKNW